MLTAGIIGTAIMISAGIFFIASMPLIFSATLVAAGLDVPAFFGVYLVSSCFFIAGIAVSEQDANDLYKSGWIDTAVNFFSPSKKATLTAERDEAKETYEATKKSFDERRDAINNKKNNSPFATGSLIELSNIFVSPIKNKVSSVTREQIKMDASNQEVADSKYKSPRQLK